MISGVLTKQSSMLDRAFVGLKRIAQRFTGKFLRGFLHIASF